MTVTLTYDLQSLVSYGHDHMQKVNGQSVPKIEWKPTDERTDGGECITSHANAIGNNTIRKI